MNFFEGLFGPFLSLFVATKGAEAVVTQEPPAPFDGPPAADDDYWRRRVESPPAQSSDMGM